MIEPHARRVSDAASRVEHLVHAQLGAAFEQDSNRPNGQTFDLAYRVAEHHPVPVTSEALAQASRHLAVEEAHQRRSSLDDRDVRAERGEDAGVLAADDA